MIPQDLTILDLLSIGAVFVLVLSVWLGAVLIWSSRKIARRVQMERRLGILKETDTEARVLHLWHDGGEATVVVAGAKRPPLAHRMERAIHAAGFNASVPVVLLGVLVTMLAVGGAVYVLFNHLVLAIAIALVPPIAFRMIVLSAMNRRAAMFERQFVDAMQLAARSLRSGHPLMGAFQLVAEEMPAPVSDLFYEICQHHEMGANIEDSLAQAAIDAPTPDVRLFAASVAIQISSGGSLSDMMDRLAAVIRDRLRIARRTRILSAQTQLSKRILIGLPIVMFLLLNVIAGSYMATFYNTIEGNIMLGISAGLLVFGAWTMNRLAVVKY